KYSNFSYLEHAKYSMPIVECDGTVYSGFNMGAGENALFEIFSVLYAAGEGALLVLDEVELGLHASAQRRLIERLKAACLETKSQIICTTHSKHIFECLPTEARFYIENIAGKTRVTPGISSEFAFSKLSAISGNELDILVEDDVAKSIVSSSLPASTRARISIKVIGSANALARQLAAIYIRGESKPTLAIFDGDKSGHVSELQKHARKMAESVKPDFSGWFLNRISFLPGATWPEAWLLTKAEECLEASSASVSCDPDDLRTFIEYGHIAGKHKELGEVAKCLGLERNTVLQMLSSVVASNFSAELNPMVKAISDALESNT
ncbi:MAG: AAA family ATPase, partial [Paucibacter sp.]|nr:AAA family ATPase [Roseateles sp.]